MDNSGWASLHLSSADFPAHDRREAMREIYGRAILRLDIDPRPDSRFHIDATLRTMPGIGVAVGTCSPVCAQHTVALIDNDDLILSVASDGVSVMRQRGREIEIKDGEAILSTCDEPGVHTYHTDARFMAFRLPRAVLAPLVGDLSTVLMRPVPRDLPSLRLLVRYADLLQDAGDDAAPALGHLVATHMQDLVALVVGATRDATAAAHGRSLHAVRLHAIKADVMARLGQSDLSADGVATRHGISGRYLRKLFEREGTSFSGFVLDQRVARAHRLLLDPRYADHTISFIAFKVGFGDLSYFNRAFRRRYSAAPSDVRASASPRARRS